MRFVPLWLVFLASCIAEVGTEDPSAVEEGETASSDTLTRSAAGYVPLRPFRLRDTRTGSRVRAGSTTCIDVAGIAGVPDAAVTVAVNVTAVSPAAAGYLTVFAGGAARPGTSTVNYGASETIANGAIVPLGGGRICVYSSSESHFIVDLAGYFRDRTAYTAIAPYRRLDTRTGARKAAQSTTCVAIAGRDGVPATAPAVVVNLTAVDALAAGFLTAYPAGATRPPTSNVNYLSGEAVAAMAVARLGSRGELCIYTRAAAHFIVDVVGYFGASTDYAPLASFRARDTREGAAPGAGSTACFQIAGRRGVPANARAVSATLTAIDPPAAGFLSAYADGRARPSTSTVNHAARHTVANGLLLEIGDRGYACVYTSAGTNYVLDVHGYWTATTVRPRLAWGWDDNLTRRCVRSPYPERGNYYVDEAECTAPDANWTIAVQAERSLASSCTGANNTQSLPINDGGPLRLDWARHTDSAGRANWMVTLKSEFAAHPHPCGAGNFTWFSFMDHVDHNGGPLPGPGEFVSSATLWYDDWTPNGGSRAIIAWNGSWDRRGVIVEINVAERNWGDSMPGTPDIVHAVQNPTLQWVIIDGPAIGITLPRRRETTIEIDWKPILQNLIARGLLVAPQEGFGAIKSAAVNYSTEVHNLGVSNAAVAELRITNLRYLRR